MEKFDLNSQLLPLAMALMQYGTPSREPKNFGQDYLRNMMGFGQMQQGAQQNKMAQELHAAKMDEIKRQQQRQEQWRNLMTEGFKPGTEATTQFNTSPFVQQATGTPPAQLDYSMQNIPGQPATMHGKPIDPLQARILPLMDADQGMAALLHQMSPDIKVVGNDLVRITPQGAVPLYKGGDYHAPVEMGAGSGMQQKMQLNNGKWESVGQPYPQFNPEGNDLSHLIKTLTLRENMDIRKEDRKAERDTEVKRQARAARIIEARKVMKAGGIGLPESVKVDALSDLEPYTGKPDVERQKWMAERETAQRANAWHGLPTREKEDITKKLTTAPASVVRDINGKMWTVKDGKITMVK